MPTISEADAIYAELYELGFLDEEVELAAGTWKDEEVLPMRNASRFLQCYNSSWWPAGPLRRGEPFNARLYPNGSLIDGEASLGPEFARGR